MKTPDGVLPDCWSYRSAQGLNLLTTPFLTVGLLFRANQRTRLERCMVDPLNQIYESWI